MEYGACHQAPDLCSLETKQFKSGQFFKSEMHIYLCQKHSLKAAYVVFVQMPSSFP